MKPLKKTARRVLIFSAAMSALGLVGIGLIYLILSPQLPSVEVLRDVRFQVPLQVYTSDGLLLAEYGSKKRDPVSFDQIPDQMVKAFLAAEDDRFFEHPGVDYHGILRAVFVLLTTGDKAQGGSTITMQVARNFFLSREKTYLRKVSEIFLSFKIEEELTKEEILELYLNKIYLGNRAYGIGSAAQIYYGKPLQSLTLAQIAMIAGLPKAPSRYNPIANPARALIRRDYVLKRMFELGYINVEQYSEAKAAPVTASIYKASIDIEAPYIGEMVRSYMYEIYGEEAYTNGYKVFTTVDSELQTAAQSALRKSLMDYEHRHGYRGPVDQYPLTIETDLSEALPHLSSIAEVGGFKPVLIYQVEDQGALGILATGNHVYMPWDGMSWAAPFVNSNVKGSAPNNPNDVVKVGDIVYAQQSSPGLWELTQVPQVAGAIVSLNPHDGSINALSGGFDFFHTKFNRAIQAKRQPGSSFKPFIYSAALEKGFTAASIINDAPVVFDDPGLESSWRPENYSGRFYGPTRLREALVRSRNLVSIRLLQAIGINYAINYATQFGFERKDLPRDLSLSLGSAAVTPMEMATAYAVFANGGYRVEPYFMQRIEDDKGNVIYGSTPTIACPLCEETIAKLQEEAEAARQAAAQNMAFMEQGQEEGFTADPTSTMEDGKNPTDTQAELVDISEQAQPVLGTADAGTAEGDANMMGDGELLPAEDEFVQPYILAKRVIPAQNVYLITSMMRDVVRRGTGRRAMQLRRNDLSGKTGTTNDQRDAWFTGFNGDIVTVAWTGFDDAQPLGDGETGARAALPMWIDYMQTALKDIPETDLPQPPGMVSVRIDPKTGLLASASHKGAIFEIFRAEHVPQKHTSEAGDINGSPENGDSQEEGGGPQLLF